MRESTQRRGRTSKAKRRRQRWLIHNRARACDYLAFCIESLSTAERVALPLAFLDRFRRKTSVLEHECRRLDRDGVYLEFGVYRGKSIRRAARILGASRQLYGFDSFNGLPRDGRTDWQQNFAVKELPEVPDNVTLIPGWFSATLPRFMDELDAPVALVHVDCDIYSSTRRVFRTLHRRGHFRPGLRIVFDELFNQPTFLWNELLAFYEALEREGLGFTWRCIHRKVRSVEDTIALLEEGRFPDRSVSSKTRRDGYWWQAAAVELTAQPLRRSPHAIAEAERLAPRFHALSVEHYRTGLQPSRNLKN